MGLFDLFRKQSPSPAAPERPEALLAGPPVFRAANVQGVGQRERQEDSFAILGAADPAERGIFALVADGMGGMADGKQASQWAAECFLQLFREREGEEIPGWFYRSVHAVSDSVYQRFGGRSGTTLVCVLIRDGCLHWLSVGDSAIYLCRSGGVFRLNREHTCLNRLLLQELGQECVEKERAFADPDAPRLTAFVGMNRLAEADLNLRPLALQSGDSLLLCSDGISGVLSPAELLEAMSLEAEAGCALLERMVLEKGVPGQDNYTGILISCRPDAGE